MTYFVFENTITFLKTTEINEKIRTTVGDIDFQHITVGYFVTLTFTRTVTLINCRFDSSCTIRSDLENCEFDDSLEAGETRFTVLHFNNLFIYGSKQAIKGNTIKIFNTLDYLEIKGDDYGIESQADYFIIDCQIDTRIISRGSHAIKAEKGSSFELLVRGFINLEIPLIGTGINAYGTTYIESSKTEFIAKTSDQRTTIQYNMPIRWGETKLLNFPHNFKKIYLNHFTDDPEMWKSISINDNKEFFYPLKIDGMKIENTSEFDQTIVENIEDISEFYQIIEGLEYFKIFGELVIRPNSSVEFDDLFILPESSKLIIVGNVKIENSIINNSQIILSSNLENWIIDSNIAKVPMNGGDVLKSFEDSQFKIENWNMKKDLSEYMVISESKI